MMDQRRFQIENFKLLKYLIGIWWLNISDFVFIFDFHRSPPQINSINLQKG